MVAGQLNGSSWSPRDLTATLNGTREPQPSLGTLECGNSLFYAGRINGIHGEPESGKSWIALIAVAQLLQAKSGTALFLDYEDTEAGIVNRLQALGVKDDVICSDRFGYVRPEEPLGSTGSAEWKDWQVLLAQAWDLIIVDSTNEAMILEGLDPSDNYQSGVFARKISKPAMRSGSGMVLLDHVTKNAETRGTWAIGAQQKRAIIRGASYLVENKRPFGRGMEGEAVLRVAKDTPGWIRERIGNHGVAAQLVLMSDAITGTIRYHLRLPPAPHQVVIDRIRAYLRMNPGASKRDLRQLSNSNLVDELVGQCESDGRIRVERTGTLHAHFWISEE